MNRSSYNTLSMAILLAIAPFTQAEDALTTSSNTAVILPATKIALAPAAIVPPTVTTSVKTPVLDTAMDTPNTQALPEIVAPKPPTAAAPVVAPVLDTAMDTPNTQALPEIVAPRPPTATASVVAPVVDTATDTPKNLALPTTVTPTVTTAVKAPVLDSAANQPTTPVLPATVTPTVNASVVTPASNPSVDASSIVTSPNTLAMPDPATAVDATSTPEPVLIRLHASKAQLTTANAKAKGKLGKIELPKTDADATLDVTSIDARIAALSVNAAHYPTQFTDKRERRAAEADIKDLAQTIDQYAILPSASPEILIRAVKVNQMSRNMDVGTESALKAGVYMRRLIALTPTDPEANYWYGVMLSEGGGVKEGIPYLNQAASKGFDRAYLSLAHAYLMINKRPEAVSALESYQRAAPDQQAATTVILDDVRAGNKSSIW